MSGLNKKLLILGANTETIRLIKKAQSMGIYTIVTDNNPKAPAKKVADCSLDIDGMDTDQLEKYCISNKIDGVLVGVADRLIKPYQKLCEKLKLPCYTNEYQSNVLTDKGKFNDLCIKYNISTIPSIRYYKDDHKLIDIKYPIFIKPVDSNSGKGMSIVYNNDELLLGLKKAFSYTKENYVLLERYMNCNDILINYTIINGEPILSAIGDRYTCKQQNKTSQVCLGSVYPSSLLTNYINNEHPKISQLLKSIKLKNAIFTISSFVESGYFYHYDPGFRLQGEAPDLHIDVSNNYDQKEFLINIALNNNIISKNIDPYFNSMYTASIWFLLKKGKIKHIEGIEKLYNNKNVFYISQRLFEDDIVSDDDIGTERQVMSRIYIRCYSREDLIENIKWVQSMVKTIDYDLNNQLLDGYILCQ